MKKLLIFFGILLSTLPSMAQQPAEKEESPAQQWVYAEILANHIPTYNGDRVMIDLGQEIEKWKYNYLKDSNGEIIPFNSAIEALNHMTAQGWEFVQAYTSGEDNTYTHYLLRMRAETPENEK